ncbi:MAG: helix-turn-helix transcriptional regulator [Gemmatimonadaceae bacterium]|nr:helix-turn-helix transcriptional regulator [Chitinophagaceae bacterium]
MDKSKRLFLKHLGERIASLREAKGLTQTELASRCEKDRQSINRLEKGGINPSVYYIIEISRALETSVSEILKPF